MRLKLSQALFVTALCFSVAIYGLSQVEAADSATTTQQHKSVLLNLTQPIEAKKTSMATASFAELTPEAMQYGMGGATLNGSIEFKMLEDRTIRSSIRWDSVSIDSGGKKVTEDLDATLNSMFRMQGDNPKAPTGTKIRATGDLEAVARALDKLKNKTDAKDLAQKDQTAGKTQSQSIAPVVAAAQDSSANNGKYLSDVGTPFNTVIEQSTTTSYAQCSDRFIDLGTMKAFKQYKPVYTKGGVQTGEGVCAPNASEYAPIQTKDGACTYRFDMANGTAIKQTQFFYTDNGTDVLVGSCRDSGTTYALYESRTGCPVATDTANMKVFPQSKLVFKVGSLEQNATECRAVSGTTGIALSEEACDPMFENDFVNHVSYLLTRLYYRSETDSSKVYVNTCGRSSSVSYPHLNDTSTCGWVMDDAKMLGYQKATTVIDTGGVAGIVTLKDCQILSTVNYSFLGMTLYNKAFSASADFTFPTGAQELTALMVGSGAQGDYSCNSYQMGTSRSSSAGGGGKAGQYKIVSLAMPSAGDTAKVVFDPAKNTLTYKAETIEVLAGQGQLAGGSTSSSTFIDIDAAGAKGAASPGACGYTTFGRFGISTPQDYPKGTDQTYGFGFGGTGWYTFAGYGISAGCLQSAGMGNVIFPDPGVVIFEYKTPKYMRPDGTTYIPSN